MTDIVEKLYNDAHQFNYGVGAKLEEAAAEIERLRVALREIVEYEKKFGIRDEGDGQALVSIARHALYGKTWGRK